MRNRYFVRTQYGVIKIKSLSYNIIFELFFTRYIEQFNTDTDSSIFIWKCVRCITSITITQPGFITSSWFKYAYLIYSWQIIIYFKNSVSTTVLFNKRCPSCACPSVINDAIALYLIDKHPADPFCCRFHILTFWCQMNMHCGRVFHIIFTYITVRLHNIRS
ncbi:hypothetical protein ARSQ2_02282 [Arsenophonus endosymbiont of Bemisia tabaci Q2]|nr:hypothetical protein ARSQ2_02282 [Arsenophonus endosymbiont of Bemisia tabaci Q2]